MGEVVSLAGFKKETTPLLSGPARCFGCGHEFVSEAPVGTRRLSCPECHADKGVFKHDVLRGEDQFQCLCGCDLFAYTTTGGAYCANCGTYMEEIS